MNFTFLKKQNFWAALAVFTVVSIALLLSLLPLIGWWGGLLALPIVALFYYMHKQLNITLKPWQNRAYSLAKWAVIFGIFLHTGCRLYSSLRVSQLASEASEQKKAIYSDKAQAPTNAP